jgi:hypothetical protein
MLVIIMHVIFQEHISFSFGFQKGRARERERERSGFGKFEIERLRGRGEGGTLATIFSVERATIELGDKKATEHQETVTTTTTYVINSLYLYFLLPHDYLTL